MSSCIICNIIISPQNKQFCSRNCNAIYRSCKGLPIPEIILTDWERGWLSGIIDGEGSVTIITEPYKTSSNLRYRTSIWISNTNLDLLLKIKSICGNLGSIVKKKKYTYTGNRKTSYVYKIPTIIQKQISSQLTLIVKKRQLEIVERVWYLLSLTSGGKQQKRHEQINSELSLLKDEIRILNKRGLK